ncbi:MAG: sugar O-acetyltransferase [Firmicutes bacterium]|nr:sugar O-acetyltransferase [Bacillota bacterium]
MTEKEKMIKGMEYRPEDEELSKLREQARKICEEYNACSIDEYERKDKLLRQLFGSVEGKIYVEPCFRCDYGFNIFVGENFYANFDVTILDVAPVRIGRNCMIAPKAGIYTATHDINPLKRTGGTEFAKEISIGDNCWIGAGAIINPGVSLGDNVVVASGAVVTKSFGNNVVVGGNPAVVIKLVDM